MKITIEIDNLSLLKIVENYILTELDLQKEKKFSVFVGDEQIDIKELKIYVESTA